MYQKTGDLIQIILEYDLYYIRGLSHLEKMILANRIKAIVNFSVHGHHADCCLTVHGPGLLENRRLFLEQWRVGERRKMAEKNRDKAGGRGKRCETGKEIALAIVQF